MELAVYFFKQFYVKVTCLKITGVDIKVIRVEIEIKMFVDIRLG